MARFNARLNLNSASNKRYTDEIYFGGVDYANPRMSVQQGHGLDSNNYVYRERAVQKRFGVRKDSYASKVFYFMNMGEGYLIDTEKNTGVEGHDRYTSSDYAILGMWSYKDYIIVNRGGWLFYIQTLLGVDDMRMIPIHSKDVESDTVGSTTRTIYKSIMVGTKAVNAFEGNGKLYILSGKYIYVLQELDRTDGGDPHFSLCALTEKGNPYIPTTTIGIVQNESAGYATRATFEQPNLLTPKRKNGFVGGVSNKRKSEKTYTYALDKEATSIEGVRISFASLPYSSRHTIGAMMDGTALLPLTDGIDPNSYKGFLFPRLGDDVPKKLVVNPEATGWKIDFRDFVVYAMDGTKLTYSTLDKIPPIEFQTGSSFVKYGKVVPYVSDMSDMASSNVTIKGYETSGSGTSLPGIPYTAFQKYEEGKYYVGLFGKKTLDGSGDVYSQDSSNPFEFERDGDYNIIVGEDGLPTIKATNTTVFRVPKNSDGTYTLQSLKVNPTLKSWDKKTEKATYEYGLCNYYQLLIFAKVNGEIRYGSVTFRIGTDDVTLSYIGKVDPQDYAGNIPLISEVGNNREKSIISIAVAYMLGLNWNQFISDFSDLYAKAGKILPEGMAHAYLAYPYHENEVNLVEVDKSKISWTETIKFHGHTLFKESPNPLTDSQIKSNQIGKYLVDKDELTSKNAVPKIYGYVIYTDLKTSSVTLYENPKGTYDGESNIECTFTAAGEEKNKDDINKCTFGIMYGTQNSRNRLFVSGNADNPNCDWHTGSREDGVGDFDYFPADSVCAYGESTPIAGYGIVSDGKLMVVKEFSDREPSVYYRTATYSVRKDDYGKSVTDVSSSAVYEESYPLTQTNSHIGALGSRLFTDFNGDALFVDTDGRIVGLDNEGTTYDNQRVANSRSQLIDPKLTECASRDNYLVSYGNELFYFLKNGEAYYTHYDDKYEWFPFRLSKSVMGNKDETIRCSCIFKGKIYFGTYDGAIFSFEKGSFTDIDRMKLKTGDIVASQEDGSLVISYKISSYVKNRGMCHISDYKGEWVLLGLVCESSEYTVDTSAKTLKFYATEGVLQPNSTYYLNARGMKVSFESSDDIDDIREGLDCFVIQDFSMTLDGNSPLKFYAMIEPETELILGYGNTLTAIQGGITFTKFLITDSDGCYLSSRNAVNAYYVTSPYLTGSLGNRKVVDTYTIISDKGYRNEVYVKTMTNHVSMDELFDKLIGMGGQVDYSNLNYRGTDYTRYDLPHTQTLMAKFYGPFISLCITSPHAVNSVLTKINFLYHYAGKTYGKS